MFDKDQVVGRNFRIVSKLGAGGMGQVLLAHDANLGRQVAIKFLLEDNTENKELTQRFLNEGRILATLNHRCVINVFASDVDEKTGLPFLVMEFVDGKSIDHFQNEYRENIPRLIFQMLELLEGIHACHQKGIIHRDLKPQNILVNKDGQLKILDFGIAKTAKKQTRTGVAMGTPHYMAPEQCLGKSEISPKADVYAIGIILWEFLTGHPPFDLKSEADDPALAIALMHLSTPPPLEDLKKAPGAGPFADLLQGMLAKKPEERPEIPAIIEALKKELSRRTNQSHSGFQAVQAAAGTYIGDIYKVEKLLGSGGMGKVFKALDTALNRVVAIKVLSDEATAEETIVERFIKEGQLLANLGHPNVLGCYAASRDRQTGTPFLVMEYVDGVLLSDLKPSLMADKAKIGTLMLQLLEGIQACHAKGIIHRDLKPSNLMVTREGILKIFDFGIAKTAGRMTKTGMTVGTPQYMSPEQCTGDKDITAQSDLYSIGIVFWELIFGTPPFVPDGGANAELSIALQHIQGTLPMKALPKNDPYLGFLPMVRRLLDKNPANRPSADEVSQALEEFLNREFAETNTDVTKRRSMRSRTSGIRQMLEVQAKPSFWTGRRLVLVTFILIGLVGILWFYSRNFRENRRILVTTISKNIKSRDFEAAARNLELLLGENEGGLLAEPFRLTIVPELERAAALAQQQGNASEALRIFSRIMVIDPGNASVATALRKIEEKLAAAEQHRREQQTLLLSAETLLPLLGPGSGSADMRSLLASMTAMNLATEAAAIEHKWVDSFLRTGETLLASEPAQARRFFEEIRTVFPTTPGLDSFFSRADQAIALEKSRIQASEQMTTLTKDIEQKIGAFTHDSDPTAIISNIDQLVTLGEPGIAGGFRRQLGERIARLAEETAGTDKTKAVLTYQKALAVFTDLPDVPARIKSLEEAMNTERIATEKAAAAEKLRQELSEQITGLKDHPAPQSLLAEIARLETEFFKAPEAATLRESLRSSYRQACEAHRENDPIRALQLLRWCALIRADDPLIPEEIQKLEKLIEGKKEELAAKQKRTELIAEFAKLAPKPEEKAARLKSILKELEKTGSADEAEKLGGQVFTSLVGRISGADSLKMLKTRQENAELFLGDNGKMAKAREGELKSVMDRRRTELLKKYETQAKSFKAGQNPDPIAKSFKDLGEAQEKEVLIKVTRLFSESVLKAVGTLNKKDPAKALELLEKVLDIGDMKSDKTLTAKAAELEKALAAKAAATPPPKPIPDKPPEDSEKSMEEIATELTALVQPERVENSVPQILSLLERFEKKGGAAKTQGQAFRRKAAGNLVDIGDEHGSNQAFPAAEKAYQAAMRLVPAFPPAQKALQHVKATTTPPVVVTPPVAPPIVKPDPPQPEPPKPEPPKPEPPKPVVPKGLFVGGPDGLPSIAQAVAQAKDGETIKIRPGKYSGPVTLGKSLTLEGEGNRDQIVIESNSGPVFTLTGNETLSNLTIRFTGSAQTDAIKVTGGSPTIKGCTLSSTASAKPPNWAACIAVYGGNPKISGNRVQKSKGMGILVRGGSPSIVDNAVSGHDIYGVWLTENARATITKNTISGNKLSGLGVKNGADPVVQFNSITGNGQNGLYVYEGGRGSYKGNTLTGNKWFGLQVATGGAPGAYEDNKSSGNSKGDLDVGKDGRMPH
jgi:parallel beta-helix repeat protein